ncbi:MAG: molybdopterin-dependent oxidoreductase [Desulfarculaceae bacterium]|nr:molybdopterin-dependent oxidoreductase [Desulfarculaceae bacterium]MCF8072184.1 molybdopterin-dependent oxidoreductase [Desulfarculaceae bacterium]MCF8100105.1 molybdopterin-dependent oxidoreductase [Desulfarculaceae bacterium]MCF8117246.1 molybdopterin-dependent oxidoreductase [Desulfarculaceae bacterium]
MSVLTRLRMPRFTAGGMPTLADSDWRLSLDGLLAAPRVYTLDQLKALPQSEVDARLTSVSGFSLRARWQGVLWRDLVAGLELKPGASHATFTSQGGDYTTTVSLADLDHPRVMLVLGVEDEPLERDYGGPLRTLIPQLWGYKSAKWLSGITFGQAMLGGYWEDRGYPREAAIEPGTTLDINTGQRRPIKGGEVTEF